MALHNTTGRYGSLSKLFHWLTALGILIMIPLGLAANNAASGTPEALAWKVQLFSAHKTLGVAVFALALMRVIWMLLQPKPAPLHPERRFETLAAETVHILLYGSLLLVPLTGWIEHAATTGFAPILWPFGQGLPFVPQSPELAEYAATAHITLVRVMVIALLLHIAGALKHALIDRDDTLARMLPGRTTTEVAPQPHRPVRPILTAVAIWGAAFGIAAQSGSSSHAPAQSALTSQLQNAQSDSQADSQADWQVTEGRIALSVQQFGSAVSGELADWAAVITYDETLPDGNVGQVEVDIAIGSLSLGSVTAQALGAEYFDVTTYPTARFSAQILRMQGQHRAVGTLTLRGRDTPVEFPFDLTLDTDVADMTGRVTLDRRAFGIGEAMQDEGQLGFDVDVDLTLRATRGAPPNS